MSISLPFFTLHFLHICIVFHTAFSKIAPQFLYSACFRGRLKYEMETRAVTSYASSWIKLQQARNYLDTLLPIAPSLTLDMAESSSLNW